MLFRSRSGLAIANSPQSALATRHSPLLTCQNPALATRQYPVLAAFENMQVIESQVDSTSQLEPRGLLPLGIFWRCRSPNRRNSVRLRFDRLQKSAEKSCVRFKTCMDSPPKGASPCMYWSCMRMDSPSSMQNHHNRLEHQFTIYECMHRKVPKEATTFRSRKLQVGSSKHGSPH